MYLEKIKTTIDLYKNLHDVGSKYNLFKSLLYNLKPAIFKKTKINFLPISASIYVNTICNYRCPFCFLINEDHKGDKKMNMDTETFNRIINSDFLKFSQRITLGGGEPYLNKNIFEFIKILKEKNKTISIYTNGSLIFRNYEEFLNNQPDYLNISHYDDKFDDLKHIFKDYNKDPRKKSVSRLSKIMQADKLENVENVINQALDTGFNRIIFQNYYPYKQKEKELIIYNDNADYQKLKKKLTRKYANKIRIIWPNTIDLKRKFNCANISLTTTIDSDGNLAKCCFLTPPDPKDGNIFEQNKDTWNSEELQNFRSQYGKKEIKKECEFCYFRNGLTNRTV